MNPSVAARSPKFHPRRLRHAPLRELTAEELTEAKRRGYLSQRMLQVERYARQMRESS